MIPGILASQIRAASGGDPFWTYVISLLHFDAPNGTTAITDETGKAWTRLGSGTREISTADSKFGGSSLRLAASGSFNGYRENSSSNIWLSASGNDLTIEFFFKADSISTTQVIFSNNGASSGYDTNLVISSSGVSVVNGASSVQIAAGGSISAAAWHHVALERVGATIYLYLDGLLVGSAAFSSSGSGGKMSLGFSSAGSSTYSGYVDDFRLTKGAARYGGEFTPPSAPFPDS